MTAMSGVCAEISGTAEAVRSVADAARIAAAEGASALIRSLSTHAGLATADARTDEFIGAAKIAIGMNTARRPCEGRLIPGATEQVVGSRIN